jgi:hypothetical protein
VKSDQHSTSNVVQFRPRTSGARVDRDQDEVEPSCESGISRLIDLSRYEGPTHRSDDFRSRMTVNVAVLVLLVSVAVAAAAEVVDIEEFERCVPAWQCGFAANANR